MLAEFMPEWTEEYAVGRVSGWSWMSDDDALMLVTCLRGLMQLGLLGDDPLVTPLLRRWHPNCPQQGEWWEWWCREPCPIGCVADNEGAACPISCNALCETMRYKGLAQALADDWLHRNALDWAELRWVVEDLPGGDARYDRLRQLMPGLEEHEVRAIQALQAQDRECMECADWRPAWLFVDDERVCDECLYDESFSLGDCLPDARSLLMPEVPARHLYEVMGILRELAPASHAMERLPVRPLEVLGHALANWPDAIRHNRWRIPSPEWWQQTAWVRQEIGGLLCFDCRAPVGLEHLSDCVMALCSHCHLPPWACPGCEARLTRSRGESAEYFTG